MWGDIKKILEPIAPIIASALGGPLAGAAVTAIEGALGISNITPNQVQTAINDPDLQLKMKQADNDFKISLQTAANNQLAIENQDTDDARKREEIEDEIDPKANRPMHIWAYAAIFLLYTLNVASWLVPLFSGDLSRDVFYLDAIVILCVLIYYFGDSIKNLLFKIK